MDDFIKEIFNKDGTYIGKEFQPNPSVNSCKYCIFNDKPDLCNKGVV
jgi:hypothetical protein